MASLPPQLAPFVSPIPPQTPQLHDPQTGKPVAWAPPTSGTGPTQITVAIATHTMATDQGAPVPFDGSWSAAFTPLLKAAEAVWEEIANVQFVNLSSDSDSNPADIRVGLADISAGLNPPSHLTFTHRQWDDTGGQTAFFTPDNRLALEDPAVTPVTALGNGDYQYTGTETTVFQCLISGLGLMLGLDTSPNNPSSVTYPQLTVKNFWPYAADDMNAVQSIYGNGPGSALNLSPDDRTTLDTLHGIRNPLAG